MKCLWYYLSAGVLVVLAMTGVAYSDVRGAPTIVTLSWAPTEYSVEYVLEISASPDLKPLLAVKNSPKTELAFRVKPGQYYMRVRGVGEKKNLGPWSEIRSFVVNEFPPKILSPNPGEKFEKYIQPPGILFAWGEGFPGTKYAIEISEGDQVIVQQLMDQPKFNFKPTKPGTYRWRTGYDVLGGIQWAGSNSIQVERSAVLDPSLAPDEAQILAHVPGQGVPALAFKSLRVKVLSAPDGETFKLSANIEGKLPDPKSTLTVAGQAIFVAGDGTFKARVPLTGPTQSFEFVTVNSAGKTRKDNIEVVFLRYSDYLDFLTTDYRRRHFLNTGLGVTSLAYQQTRVPDFHQTALTGKIGYRFILSKYFDLGVTSYLTLLPLARSRPDVSAQFLGFNMRAGWIVPALKKPWNLSVMGGVYYASMWVTNRFFGYANVWGPQLFPVISRALNNASSISSYFKFSPITDRTQVLSLGSHEAAFGIAWSNLIKKKHRVSATIDIADFILKSGDVTIHSSSVTLGAAYNW